MRLTIEAAHRCGIDERMASLAERWGERISYLIDAVLRDLELTEEQRARVPQIVPRRLWEMAS